MHKFYKMNQLLFNKSFLLVALMTILAFTECYAQTTVCRRENIYGFNEEYKIGESLCGELTDNPKRLVLYLTVQDSFLYVHSNYVSTDYNHPTKIATSEKADLETIINTIYNDVDFARLKGLIRDNITFNIDFKLINDAKHGYYDFSGASKINLYCSDGKLRPVIKIRKQQGGFELGVKYTNQISTTTNDKNIGYIFTTVKHQKITQTELKIISMLEPSSTTKNIEDELEGRVIDDFNTLDQFKQLLFENRENRTVVLGNIENGKLIKTDKTGKPIFKISIDEIQRIQKENKQTIIILGCLNSKNGFAGSTNKLTCRDFLSRLVNTLSAENIEDFLNGLSSETLHFILNETIFPIEQDEYLGYKPAERLDFAIYSKPKGEIISLQTIALGRILFLGAGITIFSDRLEKEDTKASNEKTIKPNEDESSEDSSSVILFIVVSIVAIFIIFMKFKRLRNK